MNIKGLVIKVILPLCILAAGFLVMKYLVMNRPVPQKETRAKPGALVEVMKAAQQDSRVTIRGTGIVQAQSEVMITPQVSGRVTELASGFFVGGFFKEKELLFAIEDVDYELAVDRAQALLAKAESEIAVIEGKARVARSEWDRLQNGKDVEPNPLVIFTPQLKEARANLASAEAALKQAELDLQRTRIRAPFNCRVRSEQVDLGQYVRAGNSVAVVSGTDAAEIVVPVTLEDMQWLHIPREYTKKRAIQRYGSEATVSVSSANQVYEWEGHIVRSLGEVDPKGRMIRIVVQVNDPFNIHSGGNPKGIDLELGMFVEVVSHGKMLSDVIVLPRSAMRENSTVWIMDENRKLRVRSVQKVRLEQESVWINAGLAAGDQVVLTALPGGAEGMGLRPFEEGTDQ